jgi:hypothetical protein
MGEAKRRGSFEERKAQAIERRRADQKRQDHELDMLESGRHDAGGRINPNIMALYLSALAKKGAKQ